jgi:hypothetical protein
MPNIVCSKKSIKEKIKRISRLKVFTEIKFGNGVENLIV